MHRGCARKVTLVAVLKVDSRLLGVLGMLWGALWSVEGIVRCSEDLLHTVGETSASRPSSTPPVSCRREVEDPVMQNRVGFCRRELAVNQSAPAAGE